MAYSMTINANKPADAQENQTALSVSGSKKAEAKHDNDKHSKSVFMGAYNEQNLVSRKFAMAQKTAMKRLLDQLDEDVKISDEMKERQEHIEQLGDAVRNAGKEISSINERRDELKKQHNIDPDSQEQKDLELMQKAEASKKDPSIQLTDEEKESLAKMQSVTKYQEDMLLCDKEEEKYRKEIEKNQQEILVESATIQATKKALLKVHPMVDARNDADDIMEEANKSLVNALMHEGVDKIDEKNAEKEKEMLEQKEKALEEKIQREKMKEEEAEKEQQDDDLQNIVLGMTSHVMSYGQQAADNMQANIKSLIQDQTFIDVDLKGLRVNTEA